MKVSLIHMKVQNSLKSNLRAAGEAIRKASEQKPAFIALPEYFSVPGSMEKFTSAEEISKETFGETLKFLSEVSREIPENYIVGGTVLEEDEGRFFNTSTLWKSGVLIGKYRKKNLISIEVKAGVDSGNEPAVFETDFCKIGLLVCADMFDSVIIAQTVSLGVEIIFLPVAASGTHPSVKGHPLTEKIASENGVFIIKVGNARSGARGGRSAVIAPWGIVEEVSDAPKGSIVTADLDMLRLREYGKVLNRT